MLDSKKVATINKVLAKGKLVALGALVGILLGVGGTIFFQNCNPPDEDKGAAATAVFGRFVEQTELVGISQENPPLQNVGSASAAARVAL